MDELREIKTKYEVYLIDICKEYFPEDKLADIRNRFYKGEFTHKDFYVFLTKIGHNDLFSYEQYKRDYQLNELLPD